MTEAGRRAHRRQLAWLLLVLVLATAVRLGTWSQVFGDGGPVLDGTDGYYHLRRAHLVALDWPRVIQFDRLMSVPDGARVQWPPLFDFVLGSLARLAPGSSETAVAVVGALLPVLLGILQILALYWLLSRLAGRREALCGAAVAAVLPGAVRYGLVGALDHDPMIELAALVVLAGMAGAWRGDARGGASPSRHAAEIGLSLAALVLTWAGVVIHIGLFALVATAAAWGSRQAPERGARLGSALAVGAAGAALLVLPFVASSRWTAVEGATFEGLSWLQQAALLGLALLGCALAWRARGGRAPAWLVALTIVTGSALLLLLPRVAGPLLAGMAFLARSEPFLHAVAESRPLLYLFGELDIRPLLVRLSVLPLAYPVVLPWLIRRSPRGCGPFVAAWALYTLAVGLIQARYAHAAALAVAAVFGIWAVATWTLAEGRRRVRALAAAALLMVPCAAAYVALPGFADSRLLGRAFALKTSGYDEVCRFLAAAGPAPKSFRHAEVEARESVLAPWSAGHWIHWLGRKATVVTPFGPQGQPGYRDGVRFFFLDSDEEALALLERRRVRWIVVESDLVRLEQAARLAGLDPARFVESQPSGGRFVRMESLMSTIGARLAFRIGALGDGEPLVIAADRQLSEVFRSERTRVGPYGPVPWIRIYELRARRDE